MGVRKQVEGDINKIKKGLEAQVNKEKSQRDEISKQLQVMKGKCCRIYMVTSTLKTPTISAYFKIIVSRHIVMSMNFTLL